MSEGSGSNRVDEIVGGRFLIEEVAGSGGMARVYRAKDAVGGGSVALKIMNAASGELSGRFEREAEILAGLDHPGIVAYVAHGTTNDGRFYLAMSWAEGETLSARLRANGAMRPEEVIDLGIKVADALSAAHEAGVVHRDIKPSNLIVRPDGGVTLLDFGVARIGIVSSALTQPGLLIGTPGYISPEQARGEATVGPRADQFSLGCVLYACLTGHPPFRGDDLVAVLAKILFQATPRARDERRETPPELDHVVAQLMAKDPNERFADCNAVKRALEKARALGVDPTSVVSSAVGISKREARLCAMVFVGEGAGGLGSEGATEIAERFGGALERLANGAVAVRWIEAASATERAIAAARCALLLRERVPNVPVSLATVRGGSARDEVISAAIDRAAELVRDAPRSAQGVRIDETTAGLLDARFDVKATAHGLELMGEREVSDDARRLLGVAAPCVGRDRELALLDATLAQTLEDGAARALVVIADAGVGKTRLRQEWVRRIKASEAPVSVWMGRGDPLGTRSPYGLLAQALRRAMGIRDDEALVVRQSRVRERVRTAMLDAGETNPAEIERVVMFVSELVSAPLDESEAQALYAARRDRMLMGDQLRRAFTDFVAAEARARPVVLLLEDPHWGDAATLRLVDAALGSAEDLPLLVVAFARPLLKTQAPNLWAERRVQEIKLEELSRKASERLVRAVLPAETPRETVERMVTLAHGNAFFLEELVRAVSEGKGDHLPDTVLAVVESRLEGFEPEARRLLRAASVFGQFFWAAGVVEILGDADRSSVSAWLEVLVEREVVTARQVGRFANEVEYAFRHGLVRDAAYATLVDEDRKVAHRAAASWLSSMGENDAGVLASHFELGGDVAKAAEAYARAAIQMLQANDLDHAVELAKRGLARGGSSPSACDLWLTIVDAQRWKGDNETGVKAATEVMRIAPVGGDAHCRALAAAALSEVKLGRHTEARAHLDLAMKVAEEDLSSSAAKSMIAAAGVAALFTGDKAYAARVVRLLVERRALERTDPATRATVHTFWAFFADADGDLEAQVEHFDRAADNHEAVGNVRAGLLMRVNAAFARGLVGHLQDAEARLRTSLAAAERLGLPGVASTARTDLATILEWTGKFADAREFAVRATQDHQTHGDKRMEAASRATLALALLRMGEVDAALVQAKTACELSPETTEIGAHALAALAYVSMKAGQAEAAMEASTRAYDSLTHGGMVTAGAEAFIRLVYARSLQACGRVAEARVAVASAHARLLERVAKMRSEESKAAFLAHHWENAQLLDWAKASGIA